MSDSQPQYFDAPAIGELIEPAFQAWLDSKPQRRPIAEYQGGDVLLGFGDDLDCDVYGTRKDDGSWVQFLDGEEIRLDEPASETFRNIGVDAVGDFVVPTGADLETLTATRPARVPTHFCEITAEAAIAYMML